MSDASPGKLLQLASRVAQEATAIAMRHFGTATASLKADRTVVTNVDHEIQEHILKNIAETFPDHAVVAEESIRHPAAHANPASARYCWVIDPLDGTRNYASGLACFATSIAVLDRGQPIVAVVVEHNTRATYTATLGGEAFMNGRRINVVDPPAGHDWLVGVPSSKDELSVRAVSQWSATKGIVCRLLGSASYHLALVASGAFAGTFCKQCKIWDIAAGVLLVTEAGGVATGLRGESLPPFPMNRDMTEDVPIIAATPQAHASLLSSLQPRQN